MTLKLYETQLFRFHQTNFMIVIPFNRTPRKEWTDGKEKKKRVQLQLDGQQKPQIKENYTNYDDDDSPSEESSSDESEPEFDMQQYLADLLPGDVINGRRPTKEADRSHLTDLNQAKDKADRFKYLKQLYNAIKFARDAERERRKHYILKEYEQKVRKYDEMERLAVQKKMEEHKNEVLLEAYRSERRRRLNSRKKAEKSALVEQFTSELSRRDEETKVINYYCKHLTEWAIEGMEKQNIATDSKITENHRTEDKAAIDDRKKLRKAQRDAIALEEDKRITQDIQTMMARYGMIQYEKHVEVTQNETIDSLFKQSRALRNQTEEEMKQRILDHNVQQHNALIAISDTSTHLELTMRKGLDLVDIRKKLQKNVHRRGGGGGVKDVYSIETPFQQDISSSNTGQIITLRAQHICEVGALSLAAEFTRGVCPNLEMLSLKNCEVKSNGIGRIFQGLKAANIISIRALNLRGNHIQSTGLEYMKEICYAGVLNNLQLLDLSDNELGDDGVGCLVHIIIQGNFLNIVEINLQHNSITDIGFLKVVHVLKSLQEAKCPQLQRLHLENNLISSQARRRNAPYPIYFSF